MAIPTSYSVNPTATASNYSATGAKNQTFNPGGINVGLVFPQWAIPAAIIGAVFLGGIYLWRR